MNKSIFKGILNPIVGPIVVTVITLTFIAFFYLPTLSSKNQENKIIDESLTLVNYLKTFRSYYSNDVVKKLKDKTDIVVSYDHEYSSNTIPLPATTIYNLSEKLTQNRGIKINFYSDYPFPNRKSRVLDDYQKKSIEYLRKNPTDIFINEDFINGQKVLRVSVVDIMSQDCVNCHNNRVDTPKNDWKVGDVRGVFEVIEPIKDEFVLNSSQIKSTIIFLTLIIVVFIIYYISLYFKREKELNEQNQILEEEVKKRTKDLNDSNILLMEYKKAVDSSAIVSKTDLKGRITYVNDFFCAISGYKESELIGKSHNMVRHPDTPKETFKELWETIQSKKIFKGIIKNKNKDNSFYYVATTVVPILNDKEEIVEYLSLRYDITELVEARQKAELAQKAKSIFLANMSHEIRTPLNAIIGFSDILCESDIKKEDKENAKIISISAKSLLNIINDVLDISKIESGKLELEKSEFSLFYLIEHIVELFSINAKEKNIKFVYNVDKDLPNSVVSDSVRLQQVLSNLLSNAIKFTNDFGKINFDVKVISSNEHSSKILFSIKDSGIGMTKEQLNIIFKPFSQADNGISRKFGGTGLGLAISYDIVKMLGSNINVQSEIGKGSEFSFELDFETSEKNFDEMKKSEALIALLNLDEDEDNLRAIVKNYASKMAKTDDLENLDSKEVDLLFCFESDSLYGDLIAFKEKNKHAKIIFVGNKHNLDKKHLELINLFIDLPLYGSKIFNIINDNTNISKGIVGSNFDIEKLNGQILVAEDNPNNQKLIEILLNKLGLESTIVSNGEEVIEAYKKDKYDLILMDINMPIKDGIQATKEIIELKKEAYQNIPIIALTANSIAGDKEEYLLAGMDDYLSKPIVFDKLVKMIKKYINQNSNSIKIEFSKEKVIKQLGLDEDIIDMLFDNFFLTLDNDINNLEVAILNRDFKKISEMSHYIKGACANLYINEAVKILQNYENSAKNSENIDYNLNELKFIFSEIEKLLKGN